MKDNIVAQEERLRQKMSDHSAALEAKQKTAEEKLGQQMSDQSTALEVKQKTAEEQLRRQNADCKAELESMMKTIESRMGTTVAFHAWHSTNTLYVAANETLILNHAATNIGNAYDTQTGIFTVPIDGLYDFQATITNNVNNAVTAYVGLYVDNDMMSKGVSDSRHGCWDQSTIRAVVYVKKGQKVYLKNVSSAAEYYGSISEPYTTFSGFLINAD